MTATSDASTKPKRSRKPSSKPRPLTPKQEAFCQHFAQHNNASEAYRTAYPGSRKWKPEYVHSKASWLLAQVRVRSRVDELQQRLKEIATQQFEISSKRILQQLAAIAFADPADFYVWATVQRPVYRGGRPVLDAEGKPVTQAIPVAHLKSSSSLTKQQRAAIASVETNVGRDGTPVVSLKLADRIRALQLLGQHHNLFSEKVEHQHEHRHVIEHAAAELDNRLALLTARRVDEVRQTAEDADAVPVPAEAA